MTKELQNTFNENIGNLFIQVLRGDNDALERDVKVIPNNVVKTIEFYQEKPYKISDEQNARWPKIKSISLDQNNKQIITLAFKNNPNLLALRNIIILHESPYEEEVHTLFLNDGKNHDTTTIRFKENSEDILAHLIIIYDKIAPEASALIWEALRVVTEDSLDKKTPRWKEGWSYKLRAWGESIYDEDDAMLGDNNTQTKYNFYYGYTDKDYDAKIEYNNISEEQKQKFLEAIISHFVKLNAFATITKTSIDFDIEEYKPIENALGSPERCYNYIKNNLPEALDFADRQQSLMHKEFSNIFEPTFFENIFDDKFSKHIKYGGTGIGAGISIVDKLSIISKRSPVIQMVSLGIDVSKLVTSLLYAQNQLDTEEQKPRELNLTSIAIMFAYKNVICDYNKLKTITPSSFNKLVNFYTLFARAELKNKEDVYKELKENSNISQEGYISSYLLKMISSADRIKELGLSKEASQLLERIDGETLSIASFVSQYNQSHCYSVVSNILISRNQEVYNKEALPELPSLEGKEDEYKCDIDNPSFEGNMCFLIQPRNYYEPDDSCIL